MHRDLKSANVFLNHDNTIKLGDMNVSKKANNEGLNFTQTGTPYYASPEVWKDEKYNFKSDIWSLGCVIYELITFSPPFQAEDMQGLFKKVVKGNYPKIPKTFSKDLNNLIKSMLQVNPNSRPGCAELLSMPIILSRSKRLCPAIYIEQMDKTEKPPNQCDSLLKTIYVPKYHNSKNKNSKAPVDEAKLD
jgi:NIMA (never in mitosis gene a)-related kinase